MFIHKINLLVCVFVCSRQQTVHRDTNRKGKKKNKLTISIDFVMLNYFLITFPSLFLIFNYATFNMWVFNIIIIIMFKLRYTYTNENKTKQNIVFNRKSENMG